MREISGIYKDRRRFVAHSMSFVRIEAVAEDIYSDSIMKILEKRRISSPVTMSGVIFIVCC